GTITRLDPHGKSVLITPNDDTEPPLLQNYSASARFAADVAEGAVVQKGTRLLARAIPEGRARYVSLMDGFSWRVRPSALLREILSKLDETHYWVNLSDGGHIENLASIELLRRRCRVIFIGDAECDRSMHFKGLATLVRYARIDLGIHIDLDVSGLRLKSDNTSNAHLAIGKIRYPADPDHGSGQPETGYLVYFKSSCTGDEDEVIQEYRARKPHFPHESTADQMFDEGQFEAYRALGQHIVETALPGGRGRMSFDDLIGWVESGAAGPARPSRRGSRKTP
ncbi:MAG: hypothetical protein LJE68_03435, partial [Rhodobacter sp.]|nr:hypothetical protein [Rhodobacter sp.]